MMTNKRVKYNTHVVCLDIETSSIIVKDNKIGLMYLCGVKKYDMSDFRAVNALTLNNYAGTYYHLRTWEEVDQYLYKWQSANLELNVTGIVYVQNLSFEHSYFRWNSAFFRNNSVESFISASGSSTNPTIIRFPGVEFRDTLRLFDGMGLETVGDMLGMPKLTYEKGGYDVVYTSQSTLPDVEYQYNERDLDVTFLGVCHFLNSYPESAVYPSDGCYKKIPITYTSTVRQQNAHINGNDIQQKKRSFFNRVCPRTMESYNWIMQFYAGGFVWCNQEYLFKPLENVISIDRISSYPAAMLEHAYPSGRTDSVSDPYVVWRDIPTIPTITNMFRPVSLHLIHAKIQNVQLRNIGGRRTVPFLPIAFTSLKRKSPTAIDIAGGRWEANKISRYPGELDVWLTSVDCIMLKTFYTFDLVEIVECKYLPSAKIHESVKRPIMVYAGHKNAIKTVKKAARHHLTLDDFRETVYNTVAVDASVIEWLNGMTDDDFKVAISDIYDKCKHPLNAQYGINGERAVRADIAANYGNMEAQFTIEQGDIPESYNVNPYYAIFCTAYARLALAIGVYTVLTETTGTIVYMDTDSIKCIGVDKSIVDMVNRNFVDVVKPEFYKMGFYEIDAQYDNFVALGVKKYISVTDGKMSCAVSGAPNGAIKSVFEKLMTGKTFEQFCSAYIHPNIIIDKGLTGKLGKQYTPIPFDTDIYDENHVRCHVSGISGCVLQPIGYTFEDTHNRNRFTTELFQIGYKCTKNTYIDDTGAHDLDATEYKIMKKINGVSVRTAESHDLMTADEEDIYTGGMTV